MALFRTLSAPEPLPPITGDGVVLRAPQMGDHAAWAGVRETSRKFLTPWEPTWPADDLTRPAFRQRLRRYAEDARTDQASGKDRVQARGLCPLLPLHQRHLAGPSALRQAAKRSAGLMHRDALDPCALGRPRWLCYKGGQIYPA